jgi:hypothetical protein
MSKLEDLLSMLRVLCKENPRFLRMLSMHVAAHHEKPPFYGTITAHYEKGNLTLFHKGQNFK